ncbi:hypothetical protein [Thalassomonas haliotis]|uniref:Uncharacterized protein n=1 Tax=Thalassomonas haliotis TaxID=485448 RepID=A0ABY7VDH1_9GAMM|nr:hypothetical protein [Thalassomonas haliotis]WDE11734.1 hypothetical protein H3N35_26665 [Thalassomonas haliotis]
MIFILSLLLIFVLVSVYFFFRAEKLQQELRLAKRDANTAQKENKSLVEVLLQVSTRYEEFSQHRLQTIKDKLAQLEEEDRQVLIIAPLIKNYSLIFRESMKGKAQLKAITQKCYESQKKHSYKEFTTFIAGCEPHVKRMWSGNNLNGFISLVEALLYEQNNQLLDRISERSTTPDPGKVRSV